MPTKVNILAGIARYYTAERGFFRIHFTGNKAVDWLSAILELPDLAELADDTEIPFSRVLTELNRLNKNYMDVYTPRFLEGTGKSSILFRELFPSAAVDISTRIPAISAPSPTTIESTPRPTLPVISATATPTSAASPDQVTDILKRLRDQLIFYCACIRRQPQIYSFFGGVIGASGYTGLRRAEDYLLLVRQALDNYTRSGLLTPPLLSRAEAGGLYQGSHTREIITPRFRDLMGVVRGILKININFISRGTIGKYEGETIWLSRTKYRVEITNLRDNTIKVYEAKVECSCTDEDFDYFLEEYLSTKGISLTSPSLVTTFVSTDFADSFGRYLDKLVDTESRNRAARAARIAAERDDSIARGVGM